MEGRGWDGGGGGRQRRGGGGGGSTVLGPHGRDSSKTCLRWPQTGLSRTGPPVGRAWRWRQQAAAGQFPRWLFSPLAFLYAEGHRGEATYITYSYDTKQEFLFFVLFFNCMDL